jgi:hypothetical protein
MSAETGSRSDFYSEINNFSKYNSPKKIGHAILDLINCAKAQRIAKKHLVYVPEDGDRVIASHLSGNCGPNPCEPVEGVIEGRPHLTNSAGYIYFELLKATGQTKPIHVLVKDSASGSWSPTGWDLIKV